MAVISNSGFKASCMVVIGQESKSADCSSSLGIVVILGGVILDLAQMNLLVTSVPV